MRNFDWKKLLVGTSGVFLFVVGFFVWWWQTDVKVEARNNPQITMPTKPVVPTPALTITAQPEQPLELIPYQGFEHDIQVAKQLNTSTIALQFFGDIMLDRNVAKNMGKRGLDYIFANVVCHPDRPAMVESGGISSKATPLRDSSTSALPSLGMTNDCNKRMFGAADLLIANLEGPFASMRVKTSKSIAFRFDPKLAEQLKSYGFHGFSLANNHAYDMGRGNVAYTRDVLKKSGFGYFGDELREGSEYTWVTSETAPPIPSFAKEERINPLASAEERVGGEVSSVDKIAFIGIHNTYHEPDKTKMKAVIANARQRARYVVVNVHWGDEYKRISNQKQRTLARWLVDQGADAVIGHHPHVIQEMEMYKEKPIFYSLGNFIFDQYFSQDTQEGLSVGLILQDGKVKDIHLFPFFGVKSQVQPMAGARRADFLKWMEENSRLDGGKIIDGKFVY